jgi:hypothetical protein
MSFCYRPEGGRCSHCWESLSVELLNSEAPWVLAMVVEKRIESPEDRWFLR